MTKEMLERFVRDLAERSAERSVEIIRLSSFYCKNLILVMNKVGFFPVKNLMVEQGDVFVAC